MSAPTVVPRRELAFVLLAVSAVALARLLYGLGLPLYPDEAYYWAWSVRPDWAYFDQGPGVAYYILLFTGLFGDTHFALRLAASAATIPVLLFVYLTARELKLSAGRAALLIVLLLLVPGFFGGGFLIMHDTPLIIAWTAALYCAVRYVTRRELPVLFLMFVALGLGGLSKHTMGGFVVGLALWLLFEPRWHMILRKPAFWAGVLLTGVLVSPLLIWNLENHWAQLDAMRFHRSSHHGDSAGRMAYFAGQMLTFSPIWLVAYMALCFGLLWKRGRTLFRSSPEIASIWQKTLRPLREYFQNSTLIRGDAPRDESYSESAAFRLVLANSLILPLVFWITAESRTIQANWTFASYPAMLLVLVKLFPEKSRSDWRARLFRFAFVLGFVPAVLFDAYVVFSKPISSLLPVQPHPYWILHYRSRGFEEAVDRIRNLRDELDPEAGILANRYQDAAIAEWYLPDHEYVGSVNIMQQNQYTFWPACEVGKNYIIFTIDENTAEKSTVFIEPLLSYMFEDVEIFPEEDITMDGLPIKRMQIYYARGFRNNWTEALVEYMTRSAILDLMPNLRGYESGQTGGDSEDRTARAFEDIFMSRRGCMTILKPESIIERVRLPITTGREGTCVEFNPFDRSGGQLP
ncbi:MAG: glycosyltransferase family 39 protein [Spirochaetales bacterium]|nr:glycosyltransferase family 39 protein [Leptospiraceae bacterium]MCP5479982.1 glycosyltransferase family 39 protein [Spirochaetales bacterium]MCP5486612.1 glycosyltransferase family 39 protein [Spirochaetales bacterium]